MWQSIAGWVSRRVRAERNKLAETARQAWDKVLPVDRVEVVLRDEGMHDTAANPQEYPQQSGQKPGLGFPIARVVGLLSLACGTGSFPHAR